MLPELDAWSAECNATVIKHAQLYDWDSTFSGWAF